MIEHQAEIDVRYQKKKKWEEGNLRNRKRPSQENE